MSDSMRPRKYPPQADRRAPWESAEDHLTRLYDWCSGTRYPARKTRARALELAEQTAHGLAAIARPADYKRAVGGGRLHVVCRPHGGVNPWGWVIVILHRPEGVSLDETDRQTTLLRVEVRPVPETSAGVRIIHDGDDIAEPIARELIASAVICYAHWPPGLVDTPAVSQDDPVE